MLLLHHPRDATGRRRSEARTRIDNGADGPPTGPCGGARTCILSATGRSRRCVVQSRCAYVHVALDLGPAALSTRFWMHERARRVSWSGWVKRSSSDGVSSA